MTDGIIDLADEDGIANDCSLFHKAHLAETDLMDVVVARTGPHSLDIRCSGTLDSPLAGPAQVLGAIDRGFTLSLDNSTEPGRRHGDKQCPGLGGRTSTTVVGYRISGISK
jgi:hypothetical protein